MKTYIWVIDWLEKDQEGNVEAYMKKQKAGNISKALEAVEAIVRGKRQPKEFMIISVSLAADQDPDFEDEIEPSWIDAEWP